MGQIGALRLPVHVTNHAVEAACVRSPELAHAARRAVIRDIQAEVEEAIAAGRVSERKPTRNRRRRENTLVRYALSRDATRAHVLKLVEDDNGLGWLVITTITLDEDAQREAA